VDHGCFAPVIPFLEVFRKHGIELTAQQARGPMGLHKRDHIAALLELPEVAARWVEVHGAAHTAQDVQRMFEDEFVPLQMQCVADHSELILGLLECVETLRSRDIRIGTSTGYFQEAAQYVYDAAKRQGYEPDFNVCATQVPAGRPAPWMIYRNMEANEVYPPSSVVKVGDTIPDIGEGLNAGTWTVGTARTGSEVALRADELAAMSEAQQQQVVDRAKKTLLDAGAHFVIDSVADLPPLIDEIESRLAAGERPRGIGRP
jgi:phosphonoacetaldehyde hydrolase